MMMVWMEIVTMKIMMMMMMVNWFNDDNEVNDLPAKGDNVMALPYLLLSKFDRSLRTGSADQPHVASDNPLRGVAFDVKYLGEEHVQEGMYIILVAMRHSVTSCVCRKDPVYSNHLPSESLWWTCYRINKCRSQWVQTYAWLTHQTVFLWSGFRVQYGFIQYRDWRYI